MKRRRAKAGGGRGFCSCNRKLRCIPTLSLVITPSDQRYICAGARQTNSRDQAWASKHNCLRRAGRFPRSWGDKIWFASDEGIVAEEASAADEYPLIIRTQSMPQHILMRYFTEHEAFFSSRFLYPLSRNKIFCAIYITLKLKYQSR